MTIDIISLLVGMVLMYLVQCMVEVWRHTWIHDIKMSVNKRKETKGKTPVGFNTANISTNANIMKQDNK